MQLVALHLGNEQNLNLSPHGRVIEVIAQNPGNAFIDCDGAAIDATRWGQGTAGGLGFRVEGLGLGFRI
jgi:hypothetical protein